MQQKTYLAFDLDGTLYDVSPILVTGFANGIDAYSKTGLIPLTTPSEREIISVVGLPLKELFGRLFPGLDDIEMQKINDACSFELIKLVKDRGGILIDGVTDTLLQLHERGHPMLVASNGRLEYIEAVLETYSINDYFQKPIIVPTKELPTKSDVVAEYKKKLNHRESLIMIGDRMSDKLAAEDNNIPFIACSFGHADQDEIGSVQWTAHRFKDIIGLVKEIETKRAQLARE